MTPIMAMTLLFAVTFIPGLELRASIPYGIFNNEIAEALTLVGVVLVCLMANVLVGICVFELLRPFERLLRKWAWFDAKIWPKILKKQEKLRPYVEKYGELGVAVFIGIPLPGTGAYTGAVGAYLLSLDRKKFWVANLVGVLIAGAAVTALCLLIQYGAVAEDSFLRRLFINESKI